MPRRTAEKWASFTGRSQLRRNGDVRAITVIIEQADAFAGDRATVTVEAEGVYRLKGSLASANINNSFADPYRRTATALGPHNR